ncbi:metal ABC transporter permease [Candidatus Saccharibacteria bacterium]|nr:metal ABC transporter permease [Candidatus Saccharibacteria bacterium]
MNTEQLLLTLISGTLIGGVAGYAGSLMLSRKMSATAGPLAHLAFPGVALAIILGINISFGVFPFIVLAALLIWALEIKTSLPAENLAAIVFASGVGVSLLFLPIDQAEEALVGSIGRISLPETIFILSMAAFLFIVLSKLYNKIMMINVNEHIATIEGINVKIYNLIYFLCVGLVVALGVYLVGGLITAALIAIPAAAARNVSSGLVHYRLAAILFGATAAFLGIIIAYSTSLPIGPLVVVVGVVLFAVSLFAKKLSFIRA